MWADHLVFVYPIWWGTIPALLKAFIERVFLPGFAVNFRENSPWWDKLLTGRSARLIVTLNTPSFYYRWVFGRPGHNTMKKTILQFCGVKPVRITEVGPMKNSTEARRKKWLALVRSLANHTRKFNLKLASVRRVISAGAAVPLDVVTTMQAAMPEGSSVFTPYGATECLPVTRVSSQELDKRVAQHTHQGDGICVGHPVSPNQVAIIRVSDRVIDYLQDSDLLPPGITGEIIVHGPTTTDAYWRRDEQTRLSKITDTKGQLWHRMGDAGYRDEQGRLWYCGRISQRVEFDDQVLFPDQVEAVFNTHPDVFRTALVGVKRVGETRPVLCVELNMRADKKRLQQIEIDLQQIAAGHARLKAIRTVLFHPGFPVDIRHNAKIGREQLGQWASGKLS